MIQPIDMETALWLIIDLSLAAAIIILSIRYLRRRMGRSSHARSYPRLSFLTEQFDAYLSELGGTQAITRTFQQLVEELIRAGEDTVPKSLTMREVVVKLGPSLSEELRTLLAELYRIYEPVRFGGIEPGEEELKAFRERLDMIQGFSIRVRGEAP